MLEARSYQSEAVDSIFTYFSRKAGNPIIAMPTGTGKSFVIAHFLHRVYQAYPRQKVMILTHVKELIQQNYEELLTVWPFAPAGVYSAGLNRRDVSASIIFAGIASVVRRPDQFGHVDLIMIDEAHLVSPTQTTMYQKFLASLKEVNPNLKVIGLTATPWRLGHGKLTDCSIDDEGNDVPGLFTDICFDITGINAFNRLIAEGYLCPLIPKSTALKLDVDGVHMRGGEFIEKELQQAVDKYELTASAVKEAIEIGEQRKHWLVFCAGIDHAIHTADILNDHGIPAVAVHSKLSAKERDEAIAGFKSGRYRACVNNSILTTGFNFKPIDLILCLRPTASPVLWVQLLGRGTRPAPGKENCLVLDFANNTRRLGPINDPVVPRKKGQGTGDAPVKECPCCMTWVHASLRYCDGLTNSGDRCTHEFVFETKLKQDASTADLIKGDMPVVEIFKIDHITYTEHTKIDRPPMMKASYYCGYRMFNEFVCLEHQNYAGKKAREWWRQRGSSPPATTKEGLEEVGKVTVPTHLKVWINKKYPEILSTCFDGTAFGTEEADPNFIPPSVQTPTDSYDDDIPF